jgi:hypothetical protein
MPGGRDPDDSEGLPPKLSLAQRLILALPRVGRGGDKAPLGERFRAAVVKPVEPGATPGKRAPDGPQSVEELEAAVRFADDKERLTGLLLAPVAAAIALLVTAALISDDPAAHLKSGALNKLHVNPSIYHELELVLLALALLMLVFAWFRKRLFLGIVMALYGLGIFNLHYWGFGVPFILVAAWLLVRAYRLQRDLKEATAGTPGRPRGAASAAPRPNKRYTPPTSSPKRPPRQKPDDEKRAG